MKVYYYGTARDKYMKEYVKETVANSEKVILVQMQAFHTEMQAEMRAMEARMESKIQARARWW